MADQALRDRVIRAVALGFGYTEHQVDTEFRELEPKVQKQWNDLADSVIAAAKGE